MGTFLTPVEFHNSFVVVFNLKQGKKIFFSMSFSIYIDLYILDKLEFKASFESI